MLNIISATKANMLSIYKQGSLLHFCITLNKDTDKEESVSIAIWEDQKKK